MGYKFVVLPKVQKAISKLDKPTSISIYKELHKLEKLDNPRSKGKALKGNMQGYWRYRAGSYRIICDIRDKEIIVLVVDVKHRSEAYQK